jgi:hypothetical protein
VQKTLQTFSGGQAVKNVLFLVDVKIGLAAHTLQFLLPPAFLRLVGQILILRTDAAAISFAQCIEQFAQRHLVFAKKSVADVENGFEVCVG